MNIIKESTTFDKIISISLQIKTENSKKKKKRQVKFFIFASFGQSIVENSLNLVNFQMDILAKIFNTFNKEANSF